MDILITYDVKTPYVGDSKNKAVKDAMKKIGYFDSFTTDGEEYFLPNTSL